MVCVLSIQKTTQYEHQVKLAKDFITESQNAELLLVPTHMRRANAAEKAIDVFKSHFITGLCTVDPSFPLHLRCRLIPLATIALNLMRLSRINPNLSAYELLHGAFNCNKTPLAPPGFSAAVAKSLTCSQ